MSETTRGSEFLRRRYTEKDLEALLVATEGTDVTLADFFPIGIPAPDGGWGVWKVKPGALAQLLERLLKLEKVPNIKVFPRGIPRPDVFEVHLEAGSRRTH